MDLREPLKFSLLDCILRSPVRTLGMFAQACGRCTGRLGSFFSQSDWTDVHHHEAGSSEKLEILQSWGTAAALCCSFSSIYKEKEPCLTPQASPGLRDTVSNRFYTVIVRYRHNQDPSWRRLWLFTCNSVIIPPHYVILDIVPVAAPKLCVVSVISVVLLLWVSCQLHSCITCRLGIGFSLNGSLRLQRRSSLLHLMNLLMNQSLKCTYRTFLSPTHTHFSLSLYGDSWLNSYCFVML